ncbi:hypothetical protein EI94DRAFT_1715786 [Lactarius quietus]|nr:hypothetical protein EI94DRAFT_1715786 [Lactarius quietus]
MSSILDLWVHFLLFLYPLKTGFRSRCASTLPNKELNVNEHEHGRLLETSPNRRCLQHWTGSAVGKIHVMYAVPS